MSQTTYNKIPDQAFQGMLADAGGPKNVMSAAYKAGAKGSAEFGLAMSFVSGHDEGGEPQSMSVAQTYTSRQCQLPDDTNANQPFMGISVHKHVAPASVNENAFTGEQGIADTQTVDVLRSGRIWVYSETAVDPTAAVYYRYATNGGNTKKGAFSKTTDAGNQILKNAQWIGTTTGAGIAQLEIDMPSAA